MNIFRRIRSWHLLLLILATAIAFFSIYAWYQVRKSTPPYQFKQSVLNNIDSHLKDHSEDQVDRQEYPFFHLNSRASLTVFYNAIKNGKPMDYDSYVAGVSPGEYTSEALIFVLPGIEERFSYYSKLLISRPNQLVFKLKQDDSERLYEIIQRLR